MCTPENEYSWYNLTICPYNVATSNIFTNWEIFVKYQFPDLPPTLHQWSPRVSLTTMLQWHVKCPYICDTYINILAHIAIFLLNQSYWVHFYQFNCNSAILCIMPAQPGFPTQWHPMCNLNHVSSTKLFPYTASILFLIVLANG